MENKTQILDSFSSTVVKDFLSKLITAIEVLAAKQPVVGFHHRFYVPGWIGFIQLSIVEHKMNKYENENFYGGMTYIDFANWIINSSKQICELQLAEVERLNNRESEIFQQQANIIIEVFNMIAENWYQCAPEVASICNRPYTDGTTISVVGIVYHALEDNLKPLGYPQSIKKQPIYEGPSFSDIGNHLLAMVCNMVLLGVVLSIGSLFFD